MIWSESQGKQPSFQSLRHSVASSVCCTDLSEILEREEEDKFVLWTPVWGGKRGDHKAEGESLEGPRCSPRCRAPGVPRTRHRIAQRRGAAGSRAVMLCCMFVHSALPSACCTICQPPCLGNRNTKVTKNSSRSSRGEG